MINRNKKELMCTAYYNEGNSWRINPMFIQPKAAAAAYSSATTACKDENLLPVACRDLGGNIIPMQIESVHP